MRRLQTKVVAFILLTTLGLSSVSASAEIVEDDVLQAINAFFGGLAIQNYGDGTLEAAVTEDFVIFEMGQRFTLPQFKAFLSGADYEDWESTQWSISNATVTTDDASAHIFYTNTGVFVFPDAQEPHLLVEQRNVWLESAFFVLEGGDLRLKFLQSENISREERRLEPSP